ncbi:hypothetical protein [Frigidibacter oleivorans]|uniref:hypothetical protein n=1 Tax=Frigidibacter oleivorans TaxID=2487129 RepID=UPI000F8CFD1F|nr:hypothetical protein [Frigidibacter oleivorans]
MPEPKKEARFGLPLATIAALILAGIVLYGCLWRGEGTPLPDPEAEAIAPPDTQPGAPGEPTEPAAQDESP